VDTAGKHWPQRLGEGRDFYMQPAWQREGVRISWVEWDHPNMPWDGTELRVAELAFPEGGLPIVTNSRVVAGGPTISIFQPSFARNGELLYVSDESGWGHVHSLDLATGRKNQVTSGEGEFGQAAWAQAQRSFAALADGAVVSVRGRAGFDTLHLAKRDSAIDVDLGPHGYQVLGLPAAAPTGNRVSFVGAGGQQPPRVIVIDTTNPSAAPHVVRRSDGETVAKAALSAPVPVSWGSFDGEEAHGLYYPPASERFTGTGTPPLIVTVHGGPTSHVTASWAPAAQFFATRGYAVLAVNYRGSTGHGREYMLRLRGMWGVYDVQDSKFGAKAMADRGLADPGKLVIMGGSAGGFTVLQSLVELPGFYKAGISLFGVANMFTLASDTHKFEARYLDTMLGPLPEAAAVYRERSPIFHAAKIVDPVCVFQGDIDRVVPREQSDSIVASLRSRGVPHEYHVYEGEGHGWRKAETIEKYYAALERFLKQYVLFG
jgi:dipeptidyl aminopeptidase/acylaminoacyl peptidase